MTEALRRLPRVDAVLAHPGAGPLVAESGRELVTACVRETLAALRSVLLSGREIAVDETIVLARVRGLLEARNAPRLRRAVNATGIILHTGLGRAVLPRAALDALTAEQRGYSLLEVEREGGERSLRETHVADLVKELTGAEAATVVNNNAGATLLALGALAKGREVVASRGELVEIGGSFRIPDVMRESGCTLVEVGTTNRTHLADYEAAIGPATALLLRVHASNFRIVGFTHAPTLAELVELGRRRGLPVMDDLGSGALVDLSEFGVRGEPVVRASLEAGADVVTFSGDKLLGGPQAGFLAGRKETVAKIRRHPLFRALRVDKLALTALEATLKLYRDRERVLREVPVLRMIAMPPEEREARGSDLASRLQGIPGLAVELLDDSSELGGGSAPAQPLPTKVAALRHDALSPGELASRLRLGEPCVFTRVQRDRVLLDVRTLLDGEAAEIAASLRRICAP
jgi:L-seryl-tRNA(Ser) seleniumtransferase